MTLTSLLCLTKHSRSTFTYHGAVMFGSIDFIEERMKDTLERVRGSGAERVSRRPARRSRLTEVTVIQLRSVILEYEIRHVTETTTVGGDKIGRLLLQVGGGESVAIWEEDLEAYRFVEYGILST